MEHHPHFVPNFDVNKNVFSNPNILGTCNNQLKKFNCKIDIYAYK